jgi:SAM-dependent methyltransferase
MHKAPLAAFLAANPFPQPLTDGLFYREKMRAIHRVAPGALGDAPPKVLEIGGGRSGLAALLYPAAQVTTLDRDFAELGHGPGRAQSVYVCGDACRLPFADGAFDLVTLFDVLEHIPQDGVAAREALRVTRPGGWLLVSTPNADWHYPAWAFMRRWCPPETELMQAWGHVRRGYEASTLERLFGMAPRHRASFVNRATGFYHDVAFSRLGRRKRRLLYALGAPLALAGYLLHPPRSSGSETAFAWRRPLP